MDEQAVVKGIVEQRLTELEASIRYVWFRTAVVGDKQVPISDVLDFFPRHAIGHPNSTRLKQKIIADKRTLYSKASGSIRLKAVAVAEMQELLDSTEKQPTPSEQQVGHLEVEVLRIKSEQTRSFVTEAVNCAKSGNPRAAILMSWIGAVALLQDYVFDNKLKEFNADAVANGVLKRPATNIEDLRGISKESHFLDSLQRISVIDQATKRGLKRCLDRRNDAGHPSEIKFSNAAVGDHLETLVLNVFQKY